MIDQGAAFNTSQRYQGVHQADTATNLSVWLQQRDSKFTTHQILLISMVLPVEVNSKFQQGIFIC